MIRKDHHNVNISSHHQSGTQSQLNKQVDLVEMLEPRAEVEARVVLSVRLHVLQTPTQKLKEDG